MDVEHGRELGGPASLDVHCSFSGEENTTFLVFICFYKNKNHSSYLTYCISVTGLPLMSHAVTLKRQELKIKLLR